MKKPIEAAVAPRIARECPKVISNWRLDTVFISGPLANQPEKIVLSAPPGSFIKTHSRMPGPEHEALLRGARP